MDRTRTPRAIAGCLSVLALLGTSQLVHAQQAYSPMPAGYGTSYAPAVMGWTWMPAQQAAQSQQPAVQYVPLDRLAAGAGVMPVGGWRPQQPCCPAPETVSPVPAPAVPAPMPEPGKKEMPEPAKKDAPEPVMPPQVPLAEVPNSSDMGPALGSGGFALATPAMIGDLPGAGVFVASGNARLRLPAGGRAGLKISENETPRPVNRVFLTYHYYNDILGSQNVGSPIGLHQELFGFEKTFLNGNASFGLRVPTYQFVGQNDIPQASDLGDISVILKYALINNTTNGNVFTAGLVVTAPTGPALPLFDGQEVNSTIIQPWLGFIFNMDRFYVQGFTAVLLPTDSRDVQIYTNDLGVGYRLYQGTGGMLRGIVPTAEVHVNNPLNHRTVSESNVYFVDTVDITAGAHFLLGNRSVLTVGASTCVTGPRLYDVEALVAFNFRF